MVPALQRQQTIELTVRSLLRNLTLVSAIVCTSGLAQPALPEAQPSFPTKPIRWIVPFPPAGSIDSVARIVGRKVSEVLGQQIIVDNRAGAGGRLGSQVVAEAKPDGYTQLLTLNTTYTIDRSLFKNLNYDPETAFVPVTIIAESSQLLVTSPSLPVKSVSDLIALAKAKPHELTYASSGVGGSLHLAMLYFQSITGIDIVHVPYKGGPPAVSDVMAGRVSMMFFNAPAAAPYVKKGGLRALAVSTIQRSPLMPDVPTIAESGVPGFNVSVWFGLSLPKGTPPEIVDRMYKAIKQTLADPEVSRQLLSLDAQPVGDTPQEFAQRISAESRAWSAVFQKSHMQLE